MHTVKLLGHLEQVAHVVRPVALDLVDRPRRDARLLQRLHRGGRVGVTFLAQPLRELVALARELLEREGVEAVDLAGVALGHA